MKLINRSLLFGLGIFLSSITSASATNLECGDRGQDVGHYSSYHKKYEVIACKCGSVIYKLNDTSNPCPAKLARIRAYRASKARITPVPEGLSTVESIVDPIPAPSPPADPSVDVLGMLDSAKPKVKETDSSSDPDVEKLLQYMKELKAKQACPKNMDEIEIIRRVYEKSMAAGLQYHVDYSADVGRTFRFCGYQITDTEWFGGYMIFNSTSMIRVKQDGRPNIESKALRNAPFQFRAMMNEFGQKSVVNGGNIGDSIMIPIGNGFYIRAIYEPIKKETFAFYLVMPE